MNFNRLTKENVHWGFETSCDSFHLMRLSSKTRVATIGSGKSHKTRPTAIHHLKTWRAAMYIFLLSQDLLAISRVRGVAQSLQLSLTPLSSLTELQATWRELPATLVIDLTLPGLNVEQVISWVQSQQTRLPVIAFGPHVHLTNLERAEQSGCDQVYVRGEFFSQMQNIFLQALTNIKTRLDEDQ